MCRIFNKMLKKWNKNTLNFWLKASSGYLLSENYLRAGDNHMKVASIHIIRHCRDPRYWLLEVFRILLLSFLSNLSLTCTIATSLVTDLHQPLSLLDNPAGQSRHGERERGKRDCRSPGVQVSRLWSARSWRWQKGLRSWQSVSQGSKFCLGATVTTSGAGIGAAASAGNAALVVFASLKFGPWTPGWSDQKDWSETRCVSLEFLQMDLLDFQTP